MAIRASNVGVHGQHLRMPADPLSPSKLRHYALRAGGLLREVLSAQRAAQAPQEVAHGLAAAAGTWREVAAAVHAGDAGIDSEIGTAMLSAYADAEVVADMAEQVLAQHAALLQ